MEVSGQFHDPAALSQGKCHRYSLDRRLNGPQSQSGHGVEEKNFQPSPGIEPRLSDRPTHSQPLYELSYPDAYIYIYVIFLKYL
jgi:hypothetical protein